MKLENKVHGFRDCFWPAEIIRRNTSNRAQPIRVSQEYLRHELAAIAPYRDVECDPADQHTVVNSLLTVPSDRLVLHAHG